jgi:hypothetical protein
MGLIYSTLLAASASSSTAATLVHPLTILGGYYKRIMAKPYQLLGSSPVQGAIGDSLMFWDLYLRYVMPYIGAGALMYSALQLQPLYHSTQPQYYQMRYYLDEGARKKHPQNRWAETFTLVGPGGVVIQ